MITLKEWLSNETCLRGGLISLVVVFMFIGCASSPKDFDDAIKGPQMIVEPETIRLGIAKLKDTEIVFKGKGFQPEDSVFIELLGVKQNDKTVNIPVADGNVDKNGYFAAKVSILVKVSELMGLDEIKEILLKKFSDKFGKDITEKNVKALERGFNEVK